MGAGASAGVAESQSLDPASIKLEATPKHALFFAYKGDGGKVDDGKTQHAGCLIKNGTKQIATVWLREGVEKARPAKFFYDRGVT